MNFGSPPVCPVSVLTVTYPAASAVAIAGYEMLPAHAPLPTACSLPFQRVPVSGPAEVPSHAGSQTSILISESDVGVNVAAIRQNGGRFANAFAPRPPRPGGVNCPAPTVCASVTAACGCENVERLSHVAPSAGL